MAVRNLTAPVAAPVVFVGNPLHQSGVLETVQRVGDRAGGTHQRLVELGRGEAVGRADPAEAGQDVPALSGQAVLREHRLQPGVDVGVQAAEPGDHRDR